MAWWRDLIGAIEDPFDIEFPGYEDSDPGMPAGLDCPDTQPTSPGALDTLPGNLE